MNCDLFFFFEHLFDGGTINIFHGHVKHPADFIIIIKAHNVGMIQFGRRPRLAGADPRVALRGRRPDGEELADIRRRLARLDRASAAAWTQAYLQVIAEGVLDEAEFSALEAIGFDGATGPGVRVNGTAGSP